MTGGGAEMDHGLCTKASLEEKGDKESMGHRMSQRKGKKKEEKTTSKEKTKKEMDVRCVFNIKRVPLNRTEGHSLLSLLGSLSLS